MNTLRHYLKRTAEELQQDALRIHAAQAAFFIVTSIFPFLVIILSIISFTRLSQNDLIKIIDDAFPGRVSELLNSFIADFYNNQSMTLIIINIISGLWTSSLAFQALKEGFDNINRIQTRHNFLVNRLFGTIYAILFTLAISIVLTLYVFGRGISRALVERAPSISGIIEALLSGKKVILSLIIALFFSILFNQLQEDKKGILAELPGSLFSAFSLSLFSWLFSSYWDFSKSFSIVYGSITNIAFAMLWVYFSVYIVFIGATVNKLIRKFIRVLKNRKSQIRLTGEDSLIK